MKIQDDVSLAILGGAAQGASVSLYVVYKGNKLKKLELEGLSPVERAAELKKWAKSDHFVAVVQKGDQIYAHVSPTIAKQNPDFTLEGKKIKLVELSAEEAAELIAAGLAMDKLFEGETEKKIPHHEHAQGSALAKIKHASHGSIPTHAIDELKYELHQAQHKIITKFLKKWAENVNKEAKRHREADKEHLAKKREIEDTELKKEIKKSESAGAEARLHMRAKGSKSGAITKATKRV